MSSVQCPNDSKSFVADLGALCCKNKQSVSCSRYYPPTTTPPLVRLVLWLCSFILSNKNRKKTIFLTAKLMTGPMCAITRAHVRGAEPAAESKAAPQRWRCRLSSLLAIKVPKLMRGCSTAKIPGRLFVGDLM